MKDHPDRLNDLFEAIYDNLRRIAAIKLAAESPGQTLSATALVNEVFLRLRKMHPDFWEDERHIRNTAARAIERILIDIARRKGAEMNGGGRQFIDADPDLFVGTTMSAEDIVAIDDALARLQEQDQRAAQLVKLRIYLGLTVSQAAESLGISEATAYLDWAYAKACVRVALDPDLDRKF